MKIPTFNSIIWRTGKHNISVFLLLVLLAILEPYCSGLLRFDRFAINNGEWWRLYTGHLVHLGWPHTLLNLSSLGMITLIFKYELSAVKDSIALFICITGTTFGIYFFSPDMIWYLGLSGALYGYFIYYLIKGYKVSPMISSIALVITLSKVLYEQTKWSDTSDVAGLIGGAVATESHLYGSIAGILVGLITYKFFNSPLAKLTPEPSGDVLKDALIKTYHR